MEVSTPYVSVFSDSCTGVLPIKPKPLLYPKDSALMPDSHSSSKMEHMPADVVLVGYFPLVAFAETRRFNNGHAHVCTETNHVHVATINNQRLLLALRLGRA